MGGTNAIIDAGPLVGYFNRQDEYHAWARKQMGRLEPPLHTCEAVLSEAFHLLEGIDSGSDQLLTFLERGAVGVSFTYSTRSDDIHRLLRRYADQPMSFADACLVAMTETLDNSRIVTTDDDFRRYRALDSAPLDVRLPGESH